MGKADSEELAALGLNVVLVSRTRSKLDAVAADISTNHLFSARHVRRLHGLMFSVCAVVCSSLFGIMCAVVFVLFRLWAMG